ncbi:S-methyl-5-thioribose-1-phosphate isomerase [Desulfurivibrio alkaliphilus]|uniref:Methylthioribose-1-phosphate isomerase n=1 Tax=Desulfurivibrio alkaliphilus (strain DSM 19089 / UNIQEM U267 / AHT2) TaxID=589865 RepID=D6Z554_DESAT|nr:S-methyl-5-thioribose-1-phosphate isomerase [Desulfurivibrio alkaliphilus]ADH86679.1 translation initiation factor, aIF-2BI family [Desulfurivibrio alkaliphilus AHT 2]
MKINGRHYRTIWLDNDDPGLVRIIDQRRLPHALVLEDLRTVDDFCRAIKEMHVRGAGLIGATAGFAMYSATLAACGDDCNQFLQQAAAALKATRPTASNLAWAVERQLATLLPLETLAAKQAAAKATAQAIADEDAAACRMIGEHGRELIAAISRRKGGQPVNILTHCNAGWLAFVDYGSATAPIYAAHQAGIPVHVWVDETRPWLQGARLTAWELAGEGVPHTLITDNAGGHLMQHGKVDLVLVGTDRTTRQGDVANKIGTYLKALAAQDNSVPFYVALPSSTFDWHCRDGVREIPIEERSGDEVKFVTGVNHQGLDQEVLVAPAATPAANPGFDVTPARLITALISERGIMKAEEAEILRLYPEQQR